MPDPAAVAPVFRSILMSQNTARTRRRNSSGPPGAEVEAAGSELNLRIPDSMQCCGGSPEVHCPEPLLMSFIQAFSLSVVSQPPLPQVMET